MAKNFSCIQNDTENEFAVNKDTPSKVGVFNKSACYASPRDERNTTVHGKVAGTSTCSSHQHSRDRFVNEDANIFQQIIVSTHDRIDEPPDGWVDGYQGISATDRAKIISKIVRAQIMKYCIRKLQVHDAKLDVQVLIRKITDSENAKQMEIVDKLFEKFRATDNIDYLLRAYTCDSPFYNALKDRVDSFAILIYKKICRLQGRAFKGTSYRGLIMSQEDIQAYQWAKGRENRLIQIQTMSSTSTDRETAKIFAQRHPSKPSSRSVMCTYHFSVECPTALKLNEIPEKNLACISKFPDEKEVLLLPGTLFQVRNVDQAGDSYNIELANLHVPLENIQSALKEYDEA